MEKNRQNEKNFAQCSLNANKVQRLFLWKFYFYLLEDLELNDEGERETLCGEVFKASK